MDAYVCPQQHDVLNAAHCFFHFHLATPRERSRVRRDLARRRFEAEASNAIVGQYLYERLYVRGVALIAVCYWDISAQLPVPGDLLSLYMRAPHVDFSSRSASSVSWRWLEHHNLQHYLQQYSLQCRCSVCKGRGAPAHCLDFDGDELNCFVSAEKRAVSKTQLRRPARGI